MPTTPRITGGRKKAAAKAKAAAPVPKRKAGRPALHTPELAKEVCRRLMTGKSLRRVCEDDAMPHRDTVLSWIHEDLGGFFGQYQRACATRTEVQRDECMDIADEEARVIPVEWSTEKDKKKRVPVLVQVDQAEIAHRTLRIKTRQWDMARQAPKRYGDFAGVTDPNTGGLLVLVKDLTGRKPVQGDAE